MNRLRQRLARDDVLLADGAIGTMLMERGYRLGECPELFNLERPEVLAEIAGQYADAGADMVGTNTFGASPLKLQPYGLADRAAELNRAAVQAAREAVGPEVFVAGSMGPSGKLLQPFGDTAPAELLQSFTVQARALIEAGVDAICVETMVDLNEAKLAVQACRACSDDVVVLATMTFDPTPRGYFTVMGVTIAQAARGLVEAGADAVGSNCGNGSAHMIEIGRVFGAEATVPVVIQPNAGLPELRRGQTHYPETPELMAARIADMVQAGVTVIGGCCGTSPAHIRAFRAALDRPAAAGDP